MVGEVYVDGTVQSAKKYDVYGAARATTGTVKSRQGWVGGLGHQTDPETGYTYMRARYYDPATGRFNAEDPGREGDNWFSYCVNDPVNRVDESGKGANWIFEALNQLRNIMDEIGTHTPKALGTPIVLLAVVLAIQYWLDESGHQKTGALIAIICQTITFLSALDAAFIAISAMVAAISAGAAAVPLIPVVVAIIFAMAVFVLLYKSTVDAGTTFGNPESSW